MSGVANNNIAMRASRGLPLRSARYGVGLSWDKLGGTSVDVDLQAVVINNRGSVIDAVFYNNMKAMRCITHSGDELTGEKAGFDEMVWVGLSKLPDDVAIVAFVVAVFSGGHLQDVPNGRVSVLEDNTANVIANFPLQHSEEEVDLVAAMVRRGDGWHFQLVEGLAQDGRHFMDILEPTIGNFVRSQIPGAPKRLKAAFAMDKGSVVDLPQSSIMPSVVAGLGWDANGGGRDIDLDVSAVLYDTNGSQQVDCVFFGNLTASGLTHSGDNLTGEGDGDDEQLQVNLQDIPAHVTQIIFVVNIYTKGFTFKSVRNPYCRIFDESGEELARYQLTEAGSQCGLIVARMFRASGGDRWGFQALGSPCGGNTWKDSLQHLQAVRRTDPRALQRSLGALPQGKDVEEYGAPYEATGSVLCTGCSFM